MIETTGYSVSDRPRRREVDFGAGRMPRFLQGWAVGPGRHGLGVTAIGNTLYAVAGATKAGYTSSTDLVEALTFS